MSLISQLQSRREDKNGASNQSEAAGHLVLGVMTGTSCDGIDLALCRFLSSSGRRMFEIVKFDTAPYPPAVLQLVRRLLSSPQAGGGGDDLQRQTLETVCELNTIYSKELGAVINAFLAEYDGQESSIVIASHGQTIWHVSGHSTLQLGDGEVLAHVTQRVCVTNFRAADVAHGGCGAPLVPYLDRTLAKMIVESRPRANRSAAAAVVVVLQNLGGIGNASLVEFVPQKREQDASSFSGEQSQLHDEELLAAFDTGPACVVLNELVASLSDDSSAVAQAVLRCNKQEGNDNDSVRNSDQGRSVSAVSVLMQSLFHKFFPETFASNSESLPPFDRNGCFSSLGNVDRDLLKEWLAHPYFDILLRASNSNNNNSAVAAAAGVMSFHELRGRSTGREQFGAAFVAKCLQQQYRQRAGETTLCVLQRFCDLCATAVEFTVESVALHIEAALSVWKRKRGCNDDDHNKNAALNEFILCVSGGGAAHVLIMSRLGLRLQAANVKVLRLSEALPMACSAASSSSSASPSSLLDDAKEAVCFALLGHEKLCALANPDAARGGGGGTNEPAATGAHRRCYLGQVSAPF